MDKHRGVREGDVNRVGMRISNKRLRETTARNILATKVVENVPSTIFASHEYFDPELTKKDYKPKTLAAFPAGKDFNKNIRSDVLSYSPRSSKIFIQPMKPEEKQGPKWYLSAKP